MEIDPQQMGKVKKREERKKKGREKKKVLTFFFVNAENIWALSIGV
jgi:hypothetical protein